MEWRISCPIFTCLLAPTRAEKTYACAHYPTHNPRCQICRRVRMRPKLIAFDFHIMLDEEPCDDRPKCQCICGCRRKPGARRPCALCGIMIGPGCCLVEETGNCHICQDYIDWWRGHPARFAIHDTGYDFMMMLLGISGDSETAQHLCGRQLLV